MGTSRAFTTSSYFSTESMNKLYEPSQASPDCPLVVLLFEKGAGQA